MLTLEERERAAYMAGDAHLAAALAALIDAHAEVHAAIAEHDDAAYLEDLAENAMHAADLRPTPRTLADLFG